MADLTPDTVIGGRYRISSRIGSGGMADVYEAQDSELGRRVAVKLLHRHFAQDADFVERFRREASAAAGLQHPNVVGVYDRGEWDGTSYIVMEHLAGRSLKQLVQARGALPAPEAVDLTLQVLRAARFAHSRGIIHRDIKPHNVIVGDEGRAKVTDFGIARAGASDITETGSIMGTAHYLSPEQAQGHAVSAQSDLYAVGVLLYELLTGQVPFEGESSVSIAVKHIHEAPVAPSARNAAVPRGLDAIVLRAMEKDPARRYQSADEFIAALEAFRDGTAPPAPGTTAFAPLPPPVVAPVLVEEGPDPVSEELHPRRWMPWLVGLLALTAAAVAAFLLLAPDQRAIPDVVGKRADTAAALLQNAGFKPNLQEAASRTAPRDRVFRQDPQADTRADEGSTVTLTVSTGPGRSAVPVVEGEGRIRARRAITRAGFKVDEREESAQSVAAGRATRTSPEGGSEIERGSTVLLYVSTGRPQVTVPSVLGKESDEAERLLEDRALRVVVEREESEDEKPGTVLRQDPAAGERVSEGRTVTITVAEEPADAEVPDVVGQDQNDALDTLTEAGFRTRIRERAVETPDEDGAVLDQSPASGSRRAKDSRVTITVGRFEPAVPEDQPAVPPEVPAEP